MTDFGTRLAKVLAMTLAAASTTPALAGAYIGADAAEPSLILHPSTYTGNGGTLQVGVCINPGSAVTTGLEIPVQNVIAEINAMQPSLGNLVIGGANDIPSGQVDAESALLHEVGHCIGLAHPNLATESGVPASQRNYTKTTVGSNGSFNLNDGADNVIGSADDQRGDDVNLHWFRLGSNDPFTLPSVIDSTTYSRDLSLLPGSDDYAANADRTVGALLGYPSTEAVMQQGQGFDEAQRQLGHDDVATLMFAASGVDEVAGTSDDYDIELVYRGITTSNCNVQVIVDNNTGFASCSLGFSFVGGGDHYRVTSGTVRLNENTAWYYNQTPTFDPPNEAPSLAVLNDQSVDENAMLNVPLSATDPNTGDVLSFAEVGLPGFCGLTDNGDGTGDIDCSPVDGDAGNYSVQIFALDDGSPPLSDSASFVLTVNPVIVIDTDNDGIEDSADNCVTVANADQRDTNGDGYGNVCDADFNDDCVINVIDLGIMRTVFFTGDGDADLNGDGVVNVLDLGLLRTQFFGAPGPSGTTSVCD